jgi:hypothetical protein
VTLVALMCCRLHTMTPGLPVSACSFAPCKQKNFGNVQT